MTKQPAARWARFFGVGWVLRRLVRELGGIHHALKEQNTLLTRLADHFVPVAPVTDRAIVAEETGVSFLDSIEMELAQAFVAKTQTATGHAPTDEEILIYLADEKTIDLQARLAAREREIDAHASDRRR